jgi:hypothetical protein
VAGGRKQAAGESPGILEQLSDEDFGKWKM